MIENTVKQNIINAVNNLLDEHKPRLTIAREFVGEADSLSEKYEWWLTYQKNFKDSSPPNKAQIQKVKEFFEREAVTDVIKKDLDRQSENLVRSMDDEALTEAFNALSGFFPSPGAWWKREQEILKTKPLDEKHLKRYKRGEIKNAKGEPDKLESLPIKELNIPDSESQSPIGRKDNRKELNNLLQKQINRANVLLVLYPYRNHIIEAIEQPEKKEDSNPALNKNQPPKENLNKWIEQIAKRIQSKESSKFESYKTIELYLKALTENKRAAITELRGMVSDQIQKCDENTFNNAARGTFENWEKHFLKGLVAHLYTGYAQTFKRNYDIQ